MVAKNICSFRWEGMRQELVSDRGPGVICSETSKAVDKSTCCIRISFLLVLSLFDRLLNFM